MPFTLSKAHVRSMLGPAENGDLDPFISEMDPEVHWTLNTEDPSPTSLTGVYVSRLMHIEPLTPETKHGKKAS